MELCSYLNMEKVSTARQRERERQRGTQEQEQGMEEGGKPESMEVRMHDFA